MALSLQNFHIIPRMPAGTTDTIGHADYCMDLVSNKKSTDHPLLSNGARVCPNIAKEFANTREDNVPLFQPPGVSYHAGNFKFQAHDDWESALAASLTDSGNDKITKDRVTEICKTIKDSGLSISNLLCHPADRDTVVFQNEPECAAVAAFCSTLP